jgi:hypothetical protein
MQVSMTVALVILVVGLLVDALLQDLPMPALLALALSCPAALLLHARHAGLRQWSLQAIQTGRAALALAGATIILAHFTVIRAYALF